MPDGSVWTGYYSDWSQISNDDKQVVFETRKKNKGKSPKQGRKVSDVGSKINDIKSQMADLKRTVAALSKTKGDDDGDESVTPDNAGDSFGGRQSKKQKKE
jgi:hypothetical protein